MRIIPTLVILYLPSHRFPAMATSCAEQNGTIERRLDSAGTVQVAGLQVGHTLRIGSPRGIPTVRPDAPSDPDTVSTVDHVAVARTQIVRVTDQDRRGDRRA